MRRLVLFGSRFFLFIFLTSIAFNAEAYKKKRKRKKYKTTTVSKQPAKTKIIRAPGSQNKKYEDSLKAVKMQEKLKFLREKAITDSANFARKDSVNRAKLDSVERLKIK